MTTPGEVKITPGPANYVGYPKADHAWAMFAGLAIELGGYGDVELVDPYTGNRFWFMPSDRGEMTVLDVMIAAMQAAREAGWLADKG